MPESPPGATASRPLLSLSSEEMRQLGYRVVDEIIAHIEGRTDRPVANARPRAELNALIGPLREEPTAADDVLQLVCGEIMPSVTQVDHPRFFAFVPGPGNFVGAMGDALASGFNVFAAHWLHGSGAAAVELQTIEWLCRECGYPPSAGGLFVSGGSMANLTALAAARRVTLGGPDASAVVYCSDQTHNSLAKGLRVIGFAPDQIRTVPTDERLRLSMPALQAAIAADRAGGRRPFCVVANAGTTNTAAVDPLPGIAELCQAEGMWMHVDGAYGAAAVLTSEGKALLAGLERADSITLDPHKWLFQPFEIGCVLVRDLRHLRQTFTVHVDDHGHYLEDVQRVIGDEMVFYEHGVQLTRSFRALKLWMTLRVFGLSAVRGAIEHGFRMAEEAERCLRRDPFWEVVTPAQLAMVSFVPAAPGMSDTDFDAWVTRITDAVRVDGYAMLTSTRILGRQVLRICAISPHTTSDDIQGTIERVKHLALDTR